MCSVDGVLGMSRPAEAGKSGIYWRPILRFINVCVSALLWGYYIRYLHPARKWLKLIKQIVA